MAIPESFDSQSQFQSEFAYRFHTELDYFIHCIEMLDFIKVEDPAFLKEVAESIQRLHKIVSQVSHQ